MKSEQKSYFKNWAIPGPNPHFAPDLGDRFINDEVTQDSVSGHYKLYQFKEGHRFSTDDLLVAYYASVVAPSPRRLLDLGSGIGTISTILAWKFSGATLVTLEAQADSVRLAKASVQWNGLEDRVQIIHGDLRNFDLRSNLGIFDLITGSPPYFERGTGAEAQDLQKKACRFEERGTIRDYCLAAKEHLSPGGVFVCVFPVEPEFQKQYVVDAAREADLDIFRQRLIILKEGRQPLLGLFAMVQKGDLPERMPSKAPWPFEEAPLVIRNFDGQTTAEYAAIKLSLGFPPT